ncbi:MAG TPA: hypothetical protein VF605_03130 [Allosphingosinicella sp.]|jgi:hypothetical protein
MKDVISVLWGAIVDWVQVRRRQREELIARAASMTPYLQRSAGGSSERPATPPRVKLGASSFIGWLLGAAAVLNLIEDMTWVKLSGRVKSWLDAYAEFLAASADLLFNWLPIDWIRITPVEMHLLVVFTVFQTAFLRAKFAHVRAWGEPLRVAIYRIRLSFCLNGIPVWLLALLLPEPWSAVLLGVLTATEVLTPLMYVGRPYPWSVTAWEVVQQLTGVLAVLLLLILAANFF